MKTSFVLVAPLLLGTTALFSQTSGSNLTTSRAIPCPLGLRAQHSADGDLVRTALTHPQGIGQALHLSVPASPQGAITQATIVLRGWSPARRIEQADAASDSNASRRQVVRFTPVGDGNSASDIWISGLSAITSVEIVSATYENGSHWSPSDGNVCRIAPDGLMLVQH